MSALELGLSTVIYNNNNMYAIREYSAAGENIVNWAVCICVHVRYNYLELSYRLLVCVCVCVSVRLTLYDVGVCRGASSVRVCDGV